MSTALANDMISVPVATLRPSTLTGTSLYLRGATDRRPVLYRDGNYPLRLEDLEALARRGIKRVWISVDDRGRYHEYLRAQLAAIADDERASVEQRVSVLNEVARAVLSDAFQRRDMQEIVCQAETIGRHTAALLSREEVAAEALTRVLCHDSHTFTHSANVSYYCVLLAHRRGICDPDDLTRIATGGLLHDVGKLQIPHGILTKSEKLTKSEFEIVKRHPTDGFRTLAHRSNLSLGQLMMVYQHHERSDGTGYPVGVVTNEIHPWARICAVVDVFEALTSNRAYRKALEPRLALEIMSRTAGARYDREVFECWKSIINSH